MHNRHPQTSEFVGSNSPIKNGRHGFRNLITGADFDTRAEAEASVAATLAAITIRERVTLGEAQSLYQSQQ